MYNTTTYGYNVNHHVRVRVRSDESKGNMQDYYPEKKCIKVSIVNDQREHEIFKMRKVAPYSNYEDFFNELEALVPSYKILSMMWSNNVDGNEEAVKVKSNWMNFMSCLFVNVLLCVSTWKKKSLLESTSSSLADYLY